jgi:hypothetical protein
MGKGQKIIGGHPPSTTPLAPPLITSEISHVITSEISHGATDYK